jgi:hypothetical protein
VRAVVNRPATLRYHLVDEAGAPLTPDAGHNPTVTVTAGDGSVLYASQASTFSAGDSAWEFVLPPQTQLDQLTAAWTTTVSGSQWTVNTLVDVVNERLVEPWLGRQDADLQGLSAEAYLQLADQCEEYIRGVIGYPPALEAARLTWDTLRGTLNDALYVSGTVNGLPYGWGAGKMLIPGIKFPQKIYSGSINGVALDPTNDIPKLLIQNGCLVWSDYRPWISGRYQLWLTYGEPNPSRDLRNACLKMMRHFGQGATTYPDRTAQVTTDSATILFNLPGPDRPTGLPEVDSVLQRLRLASVI